MVNAIWDNCAAEQRFKIANCGGCKKAFYGFPFKNEEIANGILCAKSLGLFLQMARQSEYLGELKKAIELKYQCLAAHRETVFVQEKTEKDETVWSGYVEAFELEGHSKARRCYAWQHIESGGIKLFTVLENQWIDSPHRAIQAAIFVGAQPLAGKMANDLELIKKRIEAAKKALYEAEIKTEDLDAIIQASQRAQEKSWQRRCPPK